MVGCLGFRFEYGGGFFFFFLGGGGLGLSFNFGFEFQILFESVVLVVSDAFGLLGGGGLLTDLGVGLPNVDLFGLF